MAPELHSESASATIFNMTESKHYKHLPLEKAGALPLRYGKPQALPPRRIVLANTDNSVHRKSGLDESYQPISPSRTSSIMVRYKNLDCGKPLPFPLDEE